MILKKPYAFLIKYFRLIHIILAIPMFYLVYKSNNIVNFFNEYVENNYSLTVNGELTSMFINNLMYLGIILIILATLAVYFLFRYKEKPRKHYVAIVVYYLLLLVLFNVCHNILEVMQFDVLEASIARTYRDISLLIVLPQYYFCIFVLLRGFGFNIKKLNFADDLKELEISEKDSEEFEFVLGVDGHKTKRTIRRFFREFSYYIKENTFIFVSLICLALIGLGTSIYLNRDEIEKKYYQGDSFKYQNLLINIEDSIKTNLAFNGTEVTKGKYYLIIKLHVENNNSFDTKLSYTNFRIKIANDYIMPIVDKSNYFADYATPYSGELISAQEKNTYLLVYQLEKEQLQEEYELKIYNKFKEDNGVFTTKYITVGLTPILMDRTEEVQSTTLNSELDLTNSNIGNTKLTVNYYNITNKYTYNYERCYNNICKNYTDYVSVDYFHTGMGSTLLVIKYDLKLDKNSAYSGYIKSEKAFFTNFASVSYKIGETEYKIIPVNLTPDNTENTLVLQVNEQIKDADEINFHITVRNKIYTINLK